jgi:hypothetical protein
MNTSDPLLLDGISAVQLVTARGVTLTGFQRVIYTVAPALEASPEDLDEAIRVVKACYTVDLRRVAATCLLVSHITILTCRSLTF